MCVCVRVCVCVCVHLPDMLCFFSFLFQTLQACTRTDGHTLLQKHPAMSICWGIYNSVYIHLSRHAHTAVTHLPTLTNPHPFCPSLHYFFPLTGSALLQKVTTHPYNSLDPTTLQLIPFHYSYTSYSSFHSTRLTTHLIPQPYNSLNSTKRTAHLTPLPHNSFHFTTLTQVTAHSIPQD